MSGSRRFSLAVLAAGVFGGSLLLAITAPPIDREDVVAHAVDATADQPLRVPGIDRVVRIDDRLLVGSEPSEESFAHLRDLGVTVVLSVDGGAPSSDLARASGLRTVHLPIGYDTVPTARIPSLVRLLREESGPIFVHCHQGRHRGPAVAAILWMLANDQSGEDACSILERCGTDPDYRGLWTSVRSFRPEAWAGADSTDAPLPEHLPAAGLSEVMLRIADARDRIADSAVPGSELDLRAECVLLEELLVELGRPGLHPGADEDSMPPTHLNAALAAVRGLKTGFTDTRLEALDASCTACHAATRR